MKFRTLTRQVKKTFSIRGVVLTALITTITTGTFQFLTDRALSAERTYWAKYSEGTEQKSRWWDDYIKALKSCAK